MEDATAPELSTPTEIDDGPLILPPERVGGMLLEHEIKDCWRQNMLGAADDARLLVTLPAQGATFVRMRERLKLAEGACRQMCHWREDARWLVLGPQLEMLHQITRAMIVSHHARPLFFRLEATLRKLVHDADLLENRATEHAGMILPKPLPLDRTEGRAVQVIQ